MGFFVGRKNPYAVVQGQHASEAVVQEQVPPEAVVQEQVPPEAVVQGQHASEAVVEEQVPPEAVVQGVDKQPSVTDKGQVPSQAVTQGPEKELSVSELLQDQQMLGASKDHSTGAEPTTYQGTSTNARVEGISRLLRHVENLHLRKDSEDSSYNLSIVEDQSWNEDSDDDPDHQQGIDSDKKIEAAGK